MLGLVENSYEKISYGFMQFIDVWRQKENAIKNSHLANILLSNASHQGIFSSPKSIFEIILITVAQFALP